MTELPYAQRTPWLDRTVTRLVGHVLVWQARRAKRRGDGHEFRHLQAAVRVGNSQPCERAHCCHLDTASHPPAPRWNVGGPVIRGD